MKFTFQPESKPLAGYTIKRAIHRGGFGEVYYALTDAGKEVALKLLRQHFDVELRGVTQCLNLKHPNLVTIFDIKQDSDGEYWIIMEYVAGKSLSQVLDAYPDGMPLEEVRKWLAGLSDGLTFLHDRGIVHRDLKPGNVFLENGVVKIGDVGLSKFISESHRSAQTQSVGTVYYMAPEVAHGRYGREVDVYSLGIVLYELLTGRVPFIGESAGEILMKHLSEKPDLSPIPRRLRPVLASALEKDPLRRTPNVRQLAEDFNKAVVGFDLPQEIPEESFLNATIADSSTINREQPKQQQMPPHGWSAPPNLKDIIAADVARAMGVAEKAARKAKEMADEAYRASKGHRRYASRIERKMERWNRTQKRCRDNYASFWNWQRRRSAQASANNAAQVQPPMGAPDPRRVRSGSRGWLKPVIIALVVLAFIPGPEAFGAPHHRHVTIVPVIMVAGLAYVAYRVLTKNQYRDFVAGQPGQAVPRPQVPVPPMPVQPAGVNVRPVEYARMVPPNVKPRRMMDLNPDTPRLIPVRQRMSELAQSLTFAALSTALITMGLSFATGIFTNSAQIAEFAGTLLGASWLLLAQAKLWEGRTFDVGMRRVSLVLSGAAIGSLAFWLHHVLVVDLPTSGSIDAAFQTIGMHSLVEPSSNGQPSLTGYIVFFVCLIGIRRWWRQADSFRSRRLAIWSIIPTAALAFLLTAIFSFPTIWGTAWAAAISATVQLSAAWVPPNERVAMMEVANRA